jgi:hypothetical protein
MTGSLLPLEKISGRLNKINDRLTSGKKLVDFFGRRNLDLARKYFTDNCYFPEYGDEFHLMAAMDWLCLAQDACGKGGISASYIPKDGWDLPFPETTGYIIGTFLAYARHSGRKDFNDRAIQMGDWELTIQDPGGGIRSRLDKPDLRVFNTGQVLLGWCSLYELTDNPRYIDAARRAGLYLIQKQEKNGSWIQDSYCGARTYYSRVDWGLLRLAKFTDEQQFAQAAYLHLQWVMDQQLDSGWFVNGGFNNDLPITHVIGYTLQGLLEAHALVTSSNLPAPDIDLLAPVRKAADALIDAAERFIIAGIKGLLPTAFDENWNGRGKHSCLTGNAQIACVLFRLTQITGESKYSKLAELIINATKRTQLIDTTVPGVRGAIPGGFPIYAGYFPFGYPNWATKFLADALMMKLFRDDLISS